MGNPEQHTQSVSKRRVLIVAACIAAATFVLLICAEIFLPSKPPSFFGLGFGPSSTTGFMVLLGPALAAWAFSIYVRCPDATIRNQLIAIAALLAFWLLDVIVKYPMKSDLGTSICWYLYYVPMLFVPALAFTCALRAAGFDTTKAGKTARSIALQEVPCLLCSCLRTTSTMRYFRSVSTIPAGAAITATSGAIGSLLAGSSYFTEHSLPCCSLPQESSYAPLLPL